MDTHKLPMSGKDRQESEYIALRSLLRDARKEAALSQVEMAERLGVPQSFVSKVESGQRRLDLIELRKICAALDCSFVDFIKRLDQRLSNQRTSDEGR